jgi:hypothetical protein
MKIPFFGKSKPVVWRQGDVFIISVKGAPTGQRVQRRPVLAEGEVTGHAHRLARPDSGSVFTVGNQMYLEVLESTASVTHEEHGPVELTRGCYEVRIQREYSPKEIRRVVD